MRREIQEALRNSVITFQQFESLRERGLPQIMSLVADLPNLCALMTTIMAPRFRTLQATSGSLQIATSLSLPIPRFVFNLIQSVPSIANWQPTCMKGRTVKLDTQRAESFPREGVGP